MLSGFVEFDGYYLESDPCLVCNNPEVPFQVSKTNNKFLFTCTSLLNITILIVELVTESPLCCRGHLDLNHVICIL